MTVTIIEQDRNLIPVRLSSDRLARATTRIVNHMNVHFAQLEIYRRASFRRVIKCTASDHVMKFAWERRICRGNNIRGSAGKSLLDIR